ncbi:type II toxin-antitoxin system VapC family toxin [Oceanithermus sp.]
MPFELIGLDSNVVIAALNQHDAHHENALIFLEDHATDPLVLPAAVYAELLAVPHAEVIRAFIEAYRIRPVFSPLEEAVVWELAAERFARYAEQRRRSGGGLPRRILADFLIAAQMLNLTGTGYAPAIASLDASFYRRYFPELGFYDLSGG